MFICSFISFDFDRSILSEERGKRKIKKINKKINKKIKECVPFILVLSLLLASCGGSDKNSDSSGSGDKEGPASAPTATGPEEAVFGDSYDLVIVCNEAKEVVSITGKGIDPDPQTHTCKASGAEEFSLSLKQGVKFLSPNNLTLSSKDKDGNPADKTTTVDVPIDTLSTIVYIDGDTLEEISASNAQSFAVGGTCTEEGEPVVVSVGGVSPETDPDCASNSWSVDIDVTSLNKTTDAISITADHSSSDGDKATQASKEVTNSFICPENFVGVPSLEGYTTHSFCVMKYEAKNDGSGKAISQAASTPWVNINRNSSITKCTDIDSNGKYDLITNDEWQSIARNIENVTSNWKNGSVGDSGGLSVGHSDYTPNNVLAASDDDSACHATGQSCNSNTWHSQRRTHTLSNGEVVWDIAGNAWEWVKDNNTVRYGSSSDISKVTDETHMMVGSLSGGTTTTSRTLKGHFGPSGAYTTLISDPWGGLGYANINITTSSGVHLGSAGGVLRGGDITFGFAGAFAVLLTNIYTEQTYGFRCVYHP